MSKIQNSKVNIIDGRKIANIILTNIKKKILNLNIKPVLAVILVGDDPASHLYVKIKEKRAKKVGIKIIKFIFPETASEKEIIQKISEINENKKINGVIVQLPLPKKYNSDNILSNIADNKDVDSLKKNSRYFSPAAGAIMEIINYYKVNLKKKNIVIIGYGKLVGRPLSNKLKKLGLNPAILTKQTKNFKREINKADILISAAGVPNLVTKDMIKNNAVVIDAGTSVEKSSKIKKNSKIIGDVDFNNVKLQASYITPPVGGVGPITVAKLLENVLKSVTKERK